MYNGPFQEQGSADRGSWLAVGRLGLNTPLCTWNAHVGGLVDRARALRGGEEMIGARGERDRRTGGNCIVVAFVQSITQGTKCLWWTEAV
jgi:hypothetical protein